ncbi:hypothetical protein GA0074695_2883 [Micromonospora viridifaciens]|uniref:Probable membrane transporter protein n=1 Tax=Micromonospora viridifaciens TaxID=1881 RepID=A0A1C4WZN3_MICVI|nr:hypothetical protein GA0074695_2883 [Micromonospora viridifaciens]
MADLGGWPFVGLLGVIFLGAIIQGTTGFGLGLFAAPVMVVVEPGLLPAALILVSIPLPLLMALREPVAARSAGLGWAFIGRITGTAVGVAAVAWFSPRVLALVVAGAVLLAVGLSVTSWRPSVTPRSLLVAGFLSGAAGTATAVGGPPMALLFQRSTGAEVRSTLGWFFFFGTSLSLVGLLLAGQVTTMHVRAAAWMALPMVAGFAVSGRLRSIIDNGRTRLALLSLATISALALLGRSVAGT